MLREDGKCEKLDFPFLKKPVENAKHLVVPRPCITGRPSSTVLDIKTFWGLDVMTPPVIFLVQPSPCHRSTGPTSLPVHQPRAGPLA